MTSDKDKPAVLEHEGAARYGGKPTFGQKLKRHCARFWWVHVIIFIILALVTVLPIIYVGYPNLAQSNINKGTIAILSESITDPTPDAVTIDLRSVLLTHSKYHPQLDSFDGSFYLEGSDTPFIEDLHIPPVKARNGTETEVKQRLQITNLDAFTEYTKKSLISEELTLRLKGKGGLKQGSLPKTTVHYNQKVNIKGFNGLKGLNVTSFRLLTESLPDGGNSIGSVFIPNPTVITLAMGNVTVDMTVAGTFIGNGTMPDLLIRPGNNTVPIHVTVNQTAVVALLQEPKYHCGILPVDIASNKSMYNGVELTYYSKALQANQLRNDLNVRPALEGAGFGFVLGNSTECS